MSRKVKPEQLAQAVMEELDEYKDLVDVSMRASAQILKPILCHPETELSV